MEQNLDINSTHLQYGIFNIEIPINHCIIEEMNGLRKMSLQNGLVLCAYAQAMLFSPFWLLQKWNCRDLTGLKCQLIYQSYEVNQAVVSPFIPGIGSGQRIMQPPPPNFA